MSFYKLHIYKVNNRLITSNRAFTNLHCIVKTLYRLWSCTIQLSICAAWIQGHSYIYVTCNWKAQPACMHSYMYEALTHAASHVHMIAKC